MSFEEIGLRMKERREELGLSIDDAVKETKIRSKYLKAIENGHFDIIPGEVYAKGFIKSYAKFLGLDGSAMVDEYKDLAQSSEKMTEDAKTAQTEPPEDPTYSHSTRPTSSAPHPSRQPDGRNAKRILTVLLVIVIALFGVNYAYNVFILANLPDPIPNESGLDPSGSEEEEPEQEEDAEDPEEVEQQPLELQIISDSPSNAEVHIVGVDSIEVTIITTERCWLRVQEDEEEPESQTLSEGDTVSYSADNIMRMRAGNSGGIEIYIDDELLEVSGQSGGVKNYTLKLISEQ